MATTKGELIISLLAVALSGITVVTCTAATRMQSPQPQAPVASAPSATAQPDLPTPDEEPAEAEPQEQPIAEEPASWTAPASLAPTPEGQPAPVLPRFYQALWQLESRQRNDHVRVVWLGDSHTQADIWTDAVRSRLQQRFGNGGPGFVHVGWTTYGYRHANVKLTAQGGWSVQPKTLVSAEKVGDGVYGLGGVRLVPRSPAALAEATVGPAVLPGRATWDFGVRFGEPTASVTVQLNDAQPVTVQADASKLGSIQHVQLESPGPGGTLRVSSPRGNVQLMGLVIESLESPGVVLDTLGLNGARVRTALAVDEAAWTSELSRRKPDLIVLAYGTNESSDQRINIERHAARVRQLVGRARAVAPDADCLVFGPIDRAGPVYEDAVETLSQAQQLAARELGCAFWSGQAAMGGKGSMLRWMRQVPQLGVGDGVHLMPKGYETIGQMLSRDLLDAYGAGVPAGAEAGAAGAPSDSR